VKVCAIVVTFNRIDLLKQTIQRLKIQSEKLDKIIIVNNASTDGTTEYLKSILSDDIEVINMEKNEGGAGGFYRGIKFAFEKEYDYMWIMDDDTLADTDALKNLLLGIEKIKGEKKGFVCSNVLYKDSKPCLMNIPVLEDVWSEYADKGLVKVNAASFVSLLVSREVIKKVGLPIKEFFIWGDDFEFTTRVSKEFECYMVLNSIVYHYMNSNNGVDIINTEPNRLARYFYEFRNKFYINKRNGIKGILSYFKYVLKTIFRVVIKNNNYKIKKISIIIKGLCAGVIFNPNIEKVE